MDPYVWKDGELVTAEKLNAYSENIEQMTREAESAKTEAQAAAKEAEASKNALESGLQELGEVKSGVVQNTKEINKTNRSLAALWKLNNGISYQYETDSETAYQKTVPTGAKLCSLSKIGGKTLVWNQLCNPSNFESTVTRNGITYTNNWDGSISVSGTAEASSVFSFGHFDNVIGHKVLVIGCPEGGSENTFSINRQNGNIADAGTGVILTLQDYDTYFKIAVVEGTTLSKLVFKPQLFDLTKMFGAGNEPATVEEFEAMFPNDYYPYNAGELLSFPMNEMVEQGKNLAIVNEFNGNANSIYAQINLAMPISFEPNAQYTISFDYESGDASKTGVFPSILYTDGTTSSNYCTSHKKYTIVSTGGKTVKKINWSYDNGNLYCTISNLQIEKSSIATEYSPYRQNIIQTPQAILDLDGYGVGINDTVYNYVDVETKTFHKHGVIDLGTLTWVSEADLGDGQFRSSANAAGNEAIRNMKHKGNLLSVKYKSEISTYNTMSDMAISSQNEQPNIILRIKDSDYTGVSAEDFKSAMSGVMCYFELYEEEIIDISDILTDDEPFEVESGGSLTFKNSNGDGYRVPIPTEEKYIVSLAEVTV